MERKNKKLKIGIVTFHWGTNYGGVLQSYALQTFLESLGYEVQIINFAPLTFRDSFLRCFKSRKIKTILSNLKNYKKEKKIETFRKENLNLTERYYSLEEVKSSTNTFDVLVTGSDQVWNPYGLQSYGLVYFLPFGGDITKKISYAASFGCVDYPKEVMKKIKPLINEFTAISVREKSGLSILGDEGFNNVELMPDPTLLLNKEDYLKLAKTKKTKSEKYSFFYTLQPNQILIDSIYKFVNTNIKTISTMDTLTGLMSIDSWLGSIYNSEFVVTNSFHGVIFSLILNKNFIVTPIEGTLTGMNDRIYTLLNKFNLEERLIESYDENKINEIIQKPINWDEIKLIQEELQSEAISFFNESISI